jgi:hypothetical protein
LAVGYWLSAVDDWLLEIGKMAVGCSILDVAVLVRLAALQNVRAG